MTSTTRPASTKPLTVLIASPLEPSEVLRERLRKRVGLSALPQRFETFEANAGSFDAIIGESAFYGMDLALAIEKAHHLLRPGGLFASLDMVWTEKAEGNAVAKIHDETKRIFGIPMASRTARVCDT